MPRTDPPVRDRQHGLSGRSPRWLGVVVVTSGVVALGCLAVDGRDRLVGFADLADVYWERYTIYSLDQVAVGLALVLTGLCLLVTRPAKWDVALAAVGGLCAAQLAGLGMVGYRKWPSFVGSQGSVPDWGLVQELAAVMGGSCAVAAVICLLFVLREGRPELRALLVAVPLGLLLAAALPFVAPWDPADLGDRVAIALMYGIPLGLALAVTGIMDFRSATGVTAAVAASGLLMGRSEAFVSTENLLPVVGLVVASSLVNLLWRLRIGSNVARGGFSGGSELTRRR
jgi:hypothetical protein